MLYFFAKRLNELHNKDRKGERGFTLIELLVVIIIIGILAAIAIPAYLAQRDKARQSLVSSDVRTAGTAASTCLAETNQAGCDTSGELQAYGWKPAAKATATVATVGTDHISITSKHNDNNAIQATFSTATGNITP